MMQKTKEFITYEKRQRTVIGKTRRMAYTWCSKCEKNSLMLLPDEAATFRGVTPRKVYKEIENGELHFEEAPDGKILICLPDFIF